MTTLIIGASAKPDRYSYKAMHMLAEYKYLSLLFSARSIEIEGHKVYQQLSEITEPIDTVTLYVNPRYLSTIAQEIIALSPRRVIFNPGTENSEVQQAFQKAGIKTLEACTLVLLRTNQYS